MNSYKISAIILLLILVNNLTLAKPLVKSKNFSFISKMNIETFYNDNIYKLSDNDLSSFENNNNPDRFNDNNIETSDDLITSLYATVGIKHKLLLNHLQIVKVFLNYDYLLNNSEKKSKLNIGISLKQYINKQNDFYISYTYHPNILTNFYKSVYEDNGVYRDFDYAKNNYFFKYNFKNIKNTGFGVYYKLDFSELYYNKYFTEYDAKNLENVFGIKYNFYKNLVTLSMDYGYKTSDADGIDEELANSLPGENFGITKNLSYRANKYGFSGSIKIPTGFSKSTLKYRLAVKYEQRYYNSTIIEDIYHMNREDFILSIKNKTSIDLSKNLTISVFHRFEKRDTESELYPSIESGKSYSVNEIGLGFVYGF